MRFILIGSDLYTQYVTQILREKLSCSAENIFSFASHENAEYFIQNQLIDLQRHVDLIITTKDTLEFSYYPAVYKWLPESEDTYSDFNFNLRALPTVLFDKSVRFSSESDSYFHATISMESDYIELNFVKIIHSVVKAFREFILVDLDRLRIDLNELQSHRFRFWFSSFSSRKKSEYISRAEQCEILSLAFASNPRKLEYDWFVYSDQRMIKDIDSYDRILKKLRRYDRINSEKSVLHSFFNKAQWTLQTDLYLKPVYEPDLNRNDTEFEEPDYILPSAFPELIQTTILEVKPHLFKILQKKRRRQAFRSSFTDGLTQLSDYERLLRTDKGRTQLTKFVSDPGNNLKFVLLSSNERELDLNRKRVKQLMDEHYPKIQLRVHEEQLQDALKYYELLKFTRP